MSEQTKQFSKALMALIRDHIRQQGLTLGTDDILVAYDALIGRIVITFEVQQAVPTALAAE
jgi:hypothetical protein